MTGGRVTRHEEWRTSGPATLPSFAFIRMIFRGRCRPASLSFVAMPGERGGDLGLGSRGN